MGVLTWSPLAGGWLSGKYGGPDGAAPGEATRSNFLPQLFDTDLPGNAAKLAAVTELRKVAADAGLTLPALATGFVRSHPAVTSVIIGPRTHDQLTSLLDVADTVLGDDVLDRIDEIVPPGTDLNRDVTHYDPPALTDKRLRRR